jgi:hypothetical protein
MPNITCGISGNAILSQTLYCLSCSVVTFPFLVWNYCLVRSSRSFPVHSFVLKRLDVTVSGSDDALKDGKTLMIKTGPFLEVTIVYEFWTLEQLLNLCLPLWRLPCTNWKNSLCSNAS